MGRFLTAALMLLGGCIHDDIDQVDSAYAPGGVKRAIHCSIDIDAVTDNDGASIDRGLDRARDRGEVLELFAHVPGSSVPWSTIEHVLAGAQSRGLPFVTYADMADGTPAGGGLAFAFDDDHVDAWLAGRDLFAKYGARLTFFITRYALLEDRERAGIRQLHDDGHDIEAHSVSHQRSPLYVEQHGLTAFLDDEAQPSIDRLVADGYTITTYAYPFGQRTDETDHALLGRVSQLRSVAMTWGGPVESPCPF